LLFPVSFVLFLGYHINYLDEEQLGGFACGDMWNIRLLFESDVLYLGFFHGDFITPMIFRALFMSKFF
jgi:hypothetical protein